MEIDLIVLTTLLLVLILIRWLAWLSLKGTSHLIAKAGATATASRLGNRVRPARAYLRERIPRGMTFIEARLTPKKFTGLALTLMALASVYIAALLVGLIDELREAEELIDIDYTINEALSVIRTDKIVSVFAFITEWANASAVVIVAVVTSALLMALGHGYLVMPLWVVLIGSQVTTYSGKYGFDRARPDFVTDVMASTPSFPSGHATSAIAVYGFIAYILSRHAISVRRRFEIVFWSTVLIMLIGFSRMLLSVHYASDVAAGLLVGGFWLLVGFAIAEIFRENLTKRKLNAQS